MFQTVLIGISLSFDAMCVSIALGVASGSHSYRPLGYAAIIFGIFQAVMPLLGYYPTHFIAGSIDPVFAGVISGIILAAIGGKMGIEALRDTGNSPPPDRLISERLPTLLLLGLLTSIDAWAVGVSFGCSCHKHIIGEAALIGVITTAISALAGWSARSARRFLPTRPAIGAGGAILVALGIFNAITAIGK